MNDCLPEGLDLDFWQRFLIIYISFRLSDCLLIMGAIRVQWRRVILWSGFYEDLFVEGEPCP